MDRTGIVVEEMGAYSKIKLLRHTACGNCGACQLGDDAKDIFLIAKNEMKAIKGDMVDVEMAASGVLSAAFIMYMIPLAGLFIGLALGYMFFGESANGEIISGLLGLGAMASCFAVIKSNEKRFLKSDKFVAKVVKVLQHSHDGMTPLE